MWLIGLLKKNSATELLTFGKFPLDLQFFDYTLITQSVQFFSNFNLDVVLLAAIIVFELVDIFFSHQFGTQLR